MILHKIKNTLQFITGKVLNLIPKQALRDILFTEKNINKYLENKYYSTGKLYLEDTAYIETQQMTQTESKKTPNRSEIINYVLSLFDRDTTYLEIGVRNPDHNFNHIKANIKYSVDPGVEFKENPVDFKLTSDCFFDKLGKNEILTSKLKFDVIFIDGLHLAEQVDRDIFNSLECIKDDGFIILHDCNPPTEWHAREEYGYKFTPAKSYWNGTTWKAFLKWRFNSNIQSCCSDTDWGVGILSKKQQIGKSIPVTNQFYEMNELIEHRKTSLNLMSFSDFKALINRNTI